MTEENKKKKLPLKLSNKVVRASQVVTATTVLIGAVTAVYTWLDQRFVDKVSSQIDGLHEEMIKSDEKTDRQITRLELMNLIQNQPTNKVEVEKVARHYFIDLGGDWYASAFYSEWAEKYEGDITFITEGDK